MFKFSTAAAGMAAGLCLAAAVSGPGHAWTPPTWVTPLPVYCNPSSVGRTFDVGPGKPYAAIGDVPLMALQAGDTVRVFWRPEPYREKVQLSGIGRADAPITFCGVPDPATRALPVIDAQGATSRTDFSYPNPWNGLSIEDLGLITVYRRNYHEKPAHITIMGFELRNASEGLSYTGYRGDTRTYHRAAAGVRVQEGDFIRIVGNRIHGNGNGIFTLSTNREAELVRNIHIAGNLVYLNGGINSTREHNLYIQTIDATIEYNFIGPVRPGSGGISLKDRSVMPRVRYNVVDCAARCVDLVEVEDHWPMVNEAAYRALMQRLGQPVDQADLQRVRQAEALWKLPVHVYGNVFLNVLSRGSSNMVHYGADNLPDRARPGALLFYNNTVTVMGDRATRYRVSLFDRAGGFRAGTVPSVPFHVFNNVFASASETPGAPESHVIFTRSTDDDVRLANNWVGVTISSGVEPERGRVTGLETSLRGAGLPADPLTGVPTYLTLRDRAQPAPAGLTAAPVAYEFRLEQPVLKVARRPADGALDLGARELP